MIDRYTLEDYKRRHPEGILVKRVENPHPAITDGRPLEIYYETYEQSDDHRARFGIFNQGELIGNFVMLPFAIKQEDTEKIATDLLEEVLKSSDFADLDRELEGKCACSEYEGIYSNCNECPKCRYKNGVQQIADSEDGCLGYMYSVATDFNEYFIAKKWADLYNKSL